jgi:hypothetical protein
MPDRFAIACWVTRASSPCGNHVTERLTAAQSDGATLAGRQRDYGWIICSMVTKS